MGSQPRYLNIDLTLQRDPFKTNPGLYIGPGEMTDKINKAAIERWSGELMTFIKSCAGLGHFYSTTYERTYCSDCIVSQGVPRQV